ncbi:hypothetical protein IWW54_004595 [Coemansia sp. RSA 2705]|nr:hypothetical protein IWW54_004595 [Coemansia sp. RSA 2705]
MPTRSASSDELAHLRRASLILDLPTSTWATGAVFFHRYCAFVSQSNSSEPLDTHVCLILCLYLATKVTEEPRNQRDMINVNFKLTHPDNDDEPLAEAALDRLRQTMTKGELILMRTLAFDFTVELPHPWIAHILYGMAWWKDKGRPPADPSLIDERIKRVAAFAWAVANQVVEAGLVDREPARIIAAACIVVALEAHDEPLPARDLDQWADVWARTTKTRITDTRRLIEHHIDVATIDR